MNDMQTTLCYIEREGRTLMLHRVKKKNDMNHDKWLGVGGKFEPGEDVYKRQHYLFHQAGRNDESGFPV